MTTSVTKTKRGTAYFPFGNSATEMLVGPAVFNLLEDSRFLDGWNHLYNTCPWATVFQSPSFVTAWYRLYGTAVLPVLVKTEYAGKLTGLLTLAKSENGLITGAGANQAEYQVWLCEEAADETFIRNALLAVQRLFPRNRILLKYIPAGVSMNFTKKDPIWRMRYYVKASPQPLMIINDVRLTNELKKKNRKEKINRLKRLGELRFERISDYAEFVSVFDEMAIQSDFRKGAMYNKVAFKTDPLRKKFLLTLFEQNNLHATVLKLNDKIIASNVSVWGNNQLHLQGINSFAAAYARYSPGIIHFLLLGKLLAEEGVAVFDLTPGADAYKETLATDHSIAYTLSVGDNYHGIKKRINAGFNGFLKKAADAVGIKRDTLKKAQTGITSLKVKMMTLARQDLASLSAFLVSKLKRQKKAITCWVVQRSVTTTGFLHTQKDSLTDLLNFDQREIRYTQQEFLADAMHRFDEGQHCYSWAEENLLLGCVWLTSLQSSMTEYTCGHLTEGFIIPLTGLYCHSKGRKRLSLFLQSVANELAVDIPHDKFYVVTDCNEDLAFETAGFQRMT